MNFSIEYENVQRCLPDTSSSTSSDYEDLRVQTSNEEALYATVDDQDHTFHLIGSCSSLG